MWSARRAFEESVARKATCNPKALFAHLQRNRKLNNKISLLKGADGEVITDPVTQASEFAKIFMVPTEATLANPYPN